MAIQGSSNTMSAERGLPASASYEAVRKYFGASADKRPPELKDHVETNNLWMHIACEKGMYGPAWKINQYDHLPTGAKEAIHRGKQRRPELYLAVLAYAALRETKARNGFSLWANKADAPLVIGEEDFAGEKYGAYVEEDGLKVLNEKLEEAEHVLEEEVPDVTDSVVKRHRAIRYAGSAVLNELFQVMEETQPMQPDVAIALVR